MKLLPPSGTFALAISLLSCFGLVLCAPSSLATEKPTIVLVLEAWHSPLHYWRLVNYLFGHGYTTIWRRDPSCASINPDTESVAKDAEFIRARLLLPEIAAGRDIVLVMHGYGGVPGAQAAKGLSKMELTGRGAKGGIIGLIMISAFIINEGDSVFSRLPREVAERKVFQYPGDPGQLGVSNPGYVFYNDVTGSEKQHLVRDLRRQSKASFVTPSGPPAWSDQAYEGRRAYCLTMDDKFISPATQQNFLDDSRVHWTVNDFPSGHSPFISHLEELASWIEGQAAAFAESYAKEEEAKRKWDERCQEIEAGKRQSTLDLLQDRGYVNATVGGQYQNLKNLMDQKRVGAYVGIDPTAPSLHVGHLVPLMALFWMFLHGYHSVTLIEIGGSTAGIGDPTGRTKDREQMSSHIRKGNIVTMHYQLKALWANVEKHGRNYGYQWEWAWRRALKNNNHWWNNLPFLEVLRLLGSGMRVGAMLGRDTAKNKLESGDGLSFGEFTYPILQAYDWWHMYSTFQLNGIQLQIGGSDQYGNILAGVEAINHIRKHHYEPEVRKEKVGELNNPMGFTVPLLTTSSGEKFGKSAGNAVWLDKDMTSPFDLYQFFLRSSDGDVSRYLKLFTFIPSQDIEAIMVEHRQDPSKRVAQRRLAQEVLLVVHGEAETRAVEVQHGLLFRPSKTALKREARAEKMGDMSTDSAPKSTDINYLLNKAAPPDQPGAAGNVTLPRSLVFGQQVGRILYACGLVASRSEGHRLIAKKGAYVGSLPGKQHTTIPNHVEFAPVGNWQDEYVDRFIIDGKLLILRAGKWKVKMIRIVEDEEFERLGLDAPGWKEWKQQQEKQRSR
ncbi:MAG: hypothetical protein Q9219_005523 [cf. Caloplaca sp. 3 TL-2023]